MQYYYVDAGIVIIQYSQENSLNFPTLVCSKCGGKRNMNGKGRGSLARGVLGERISNGWGALGHGKEGRKRGEQCCIKWTREKEGRASKKGGVVLS